MSKKLMGSTNDLGWEADFEPEGATRFSFKYAGKKLFDCDGVEMGFLKESHGMQKHLRFHTSEKSSWYSVDSKVVCPFGSEPVINRRIEQSGNFMRVITDVLIKSAMELGFLKIDTLKIPGEWETLTIYYHPTNESSNILSKTVPVKEIDTHGVMFETIPLVLLLTDKEGTQLELGTGYDLWRWNNAARFRAENRFVIKKERDHLLFERAPFLWAEGDETEKFNFRFSWYFSWGRDCSTENKGKEKATPLIVSNNKLVSYEQGTSDYYLDYSNWPVSTKTSDSDESCFSSRQTENMLKDFLRKSLPRMGEEDKSLFLQRITPHVCSDSRHVQRNKAGNFIHWDYWDMMLLWKWANTLLSSSNKRFGFIPDPQSPLASLPSFKGMANLEG